MATMNVLNASIRQSVVRELHLTKKVGIFAGTFDPIHDGHISVAEEAIKHLELDKIYFMVEKYPWSHKQPVSIEHRIEMVDRAIVKNATLSQFIIENERFTLKETLPIIEQHFKNAELYFIFGADVFLRINQDRWPGLEKLLKHYIVVFEREGITEQELERYAKELGIVTAIIPSLHKKHNSTDIRMQPDKREIWVPKEVAQYIRQHNLYTT